MDIRIRIVPSTVGRNPKKKNIRPKIPQLVGRSPLIVHFADVRLKGHRTVFVTFRNTKTRYFDVEIPR